MNNKGLQKPLKKKKKNILQCSKNDFKRMTYTNGDYSKNGFFKQQTLIAE